MMRAFALATAIFASGCATITPATYSMSNDNNAALKQFKGNKVRVTAVTGINDFNPRCGLFNFIVTANNEPVPQFIKNAFNDELMFAGLHAYDGVSLTVELTKIDFNPDRLITKKGSLDLGMLFKSRSGAWEIAMLLKSRNGKSITVENYYEFATRGDASSACNQTTQALVPAVQQLIYEAITNPEFITLIQP